MYIEIMTTHNEHISIWHL